MPNNVSNKLKIQCEDSAIMAKIKKMILKEDINNETEFSMEILLPRSIAFADDERYDLNWNRAVWGTKWDIYNDSIIESGDTLTVNYSTAWNPNDGWVETLCCYLDHYIRLNFRGIELSIEHRYSDYPGDFGGILEWKPGDKFQYIHYNSYNEYLKVHDKEGYDMIMEAEARMRIEQDKIHRQNLPI